MARRAFIPAWLPKWEAMKPGPEKDKYLKSIHDMGKSQRNKGHNWEREVVNLLKDKGIPAARNLTQTRDSGSDISLPGWMLECKRYAKIAVCTWLEQAIKSAKENQVPVVIAKADRKEAMAIMRLSDFINIMETIDRGVIDGRQLDGDCKKIPGSIGTKES